MALYNSFLEWKQGIARWIDVTDGTVFDQIPEFIILGEIELDKRLKLRESIRFLNNTIDNDGVLTLPADFNIMKSLTLDVDHRILDAVTPDRYYDAFRRSAGSGTSGGLQDSFPIFYTIIGNNLQFFPLGPGQGISIAYYRKAEPLSDVVDTNIYTDLAPECLLAAAVMYGMKALFEEERQTFWSMRLQHDIDTLNQNSQKAELGSSPLVMRTPLRRRITGYR